MFEIDDGPTNHVGAFLKSKREERHISLEEVAENIKVRLCHLEAIEENKPKELPGRVYERTFVKAYAEYLGLDFDELALRFFPEAKREESRIKPPLKAKRKFAFSWGIIILAIIALLILALVILNSGKKEGGETSNQLSSSQIQKLNLVSKKENLTTPANHTTSVPKIMNLKLEAKERAWVRIKADQEAVFAGFITPGNAKEFKAQNGFVLDVGKAGAIRANLDGIKLKPFGKHNGSALNLVLNRDNYQTFIDSAQLTYIQ
jgi:cytoskeleton protein RodZ